MAWRCQECDYLGEEIIETEEHDEGCPVCKGDCIEVTMMTDEEEKILEKFFTDNINNFVMPYPDEELNHNDSYMEQPSWEDFHAIKQMPNKDELFFYTVVHCDNDEAWLLDGYHFINRIGYFVSTKKIDIPEDGIRYW